MRNAFKKAITELIAEDKRIVMITADLGFGVFEELQEKYPNQFLNVGVAEQNMTAIATGMALEGHVVFTYSIGNFPTFRCLEQIRNDAAYHEANINIVCTGGGFSYGALGMSHHATEDISVMRALPGVTSVAPATAWETYHATKQLAASPGVGYLRIEKTPSVPIPWPEENYSIGKSRRLMEGRDLTLIATGGIVFEAYKAAEVLKTKDIHCRVISMHTLKPLDKEQVRLACQETGGVITIEENTVIGGLAGAVAETCLELGVHPKKFRRIGMKDSYSSIVGSQDYLRTHYQMNAEAIVTTATEIL